MYENWSNIAKVVFQRTYSRESNGKLENWEDTLKRAIKGNISLVSPQFIRKDEQSSLLKLGMERKATFAGRGLWFSGTDAALKIGGNALNNCWVTTSEDWNNLIMAQDLMMLGGGVGLSVEHRFTSKLPKIKKNVIIRHEKTKDADFIVPDSREGWNELTRRVLESFWVTGRSFTYSTVCLRGKGEKIKGFGGKSSGPIPLIDFVAKLCNILDSRSGRYARPIDIADIMCLIGEMVVSGNVRRAAILILGDPWDKEILKAKRWDLGPIPNHRSKANFTVVCDDIDDLHPLFWKTYEHGEPFGLFNRLNAQKYGRMEELKKDKCIGVNPCVSGDTQILTKRGWKEISHLVDRETQIWNGFEWSTVVPRITGENQRLLKIKFSDGREIKCTPYHKFHLSRDYKGTVDIVEAHDIKLGDKLIKCTFPVLQEGKESSPLKMYTQGFYSADGEKNSNYIALYEPKWGLEEFMDVRKLGSVCENDVGVKRQIYAVNFELKNKSWVPFNYNYKERLNWLSGLMDGDECELKEGGSQISSIDREFLLGVQKLLTTLGTNSKLVDGHEEGKRFLPDQKGGTKEYFCQKMYRLCIGAMEIQNLLKLGLNCKRLKFFKSPNRDASRFSVVTGIEEAGTAKFVYCFNEPLKHLGVFNGVITGQCSEATLEDGEPCNLAEIFLSNIKSKEEFVKTCKLMTRAAIRTTCAYYPHKKSADVVKKNRRIGIGITGCLQSPLFTPETLDAGYKAIEEEAESYCSEMGIARCVRLTVVKPSGTLSLIGECTAGAHPAYSRYLIRRVRFSSNDPLLPLLRDAGHFMEPEKQMDGSYNHDTMVVDFYMETPEGVPCADEGFDTWKQLDVLVMLQKYWSDQAVSCTVYYKKEDLPKVKEWVKENISKIKTVSFLLHTGHGFVQAPLEPISKEDYERLSVKIKPIDISKLELVDVGELEGAECAGGACPVK